MRDVRVHEAFPTEIHNHSLQMPRACDTSGMEPGKNPRLILTVSGLFALIGILTFISVWRMTPTDPSKEQYAKIFKSASEQEAELAAKQAVLASLSASTTSKGPSEEQKLKVLESLQAQQ